MGKYGILAKLKRQKKKHSGKILNNIIIRIPAFDATISQQVEDRKDDAKA
jgi:hypothetical protein